LSTSETVFYFLGHLPAQMLHGEALYRKLPGPCIVLSEDAKAYCEKRGLQTLLLDNHTVGYRPFKFRQVKNYTRFDFSEIPNTVNYLNRRHGIIFFFDTYPGINSLHSLKKIMLFHGNSIKVNWFQPWRINCLKQYDKMTTLGPFWENILKKKGLPQDRFLKIGQTRCDEIISLGSKPENQEKIYARLSSRPKPILSYMPTWYGPSSLCDVGTALLRNVSDDFILMLRPHPETPASILQEINKTVRARKYMILSHKDYDDSISLMTMLSSSDAFIMDLSSLLIDCLLLDRPILFAHGGNYFQTLWNRRVYRPIQEVFNRSEQITRLNVSSADILIRKALSQTPDKAARHCVKERFFYNLDGHAADKLVEAVKHDLVNL